ncbi:hypothetical protein [Myceligenerans indicum]|uniref:Uncharacterized protein n=1 Tax=Myceligenerans indicum TaxID=2593663 RepID=A0ABS1LLR1_9MICO|nr:hypothetical protein [Myceligenerans indicum]MBL0887200.1 hypothetical protein [Myceligenerans indicum]
MKDAVGRSAPRIAAVAGAGVALALAAVTTAASASAAVPPPEARGVAVGVGAEVRAAGPGVRPAPAGRSAANGGGVTGHDDFLVLVPGQTRRGLPPGVRLGDDATVAGGAWTPAEGLLYVVTLGSSTCPRTAEPAARDTMTGAGLAADREVGDIDVTLSQPPLESVCTTDWVPTTTVVAAPEGTDDGRTVRLRIGPVGKVELPPRPARGEAGPAAWISFAD